MNCRVLPAGAATLRVAPAAPVAAYAAIACTRSRGTSYGGLPVPAALVAERVRIAGGSEGPAGTFADNLPGQLRERLTDGRLFLAGGASLVRRGTGRPCNVCGQAIPKHETEHQVEHNPGKGRSPVIAVAHADCYRLWREESRKRLPPLS